MGSNLRPKEPRKMGLLGRKAYSIGGGGDLQLSIANQQPMIITCGKQ